MVRSDEPQCGIAARMQLCRGTLPVQSKPFYYAIRTHSDTTGRMEKSALTRATGAGFAFSPLLVFILQKRKLGISVDFFQWKVRFRLSALTF